MTLPTELNQVTPDWLTDRLHENGYLDAAGRITSVTRHGNPLWNVAETAFLELKGAGLGALPGHLFAKLTTSADPLERFMPGEYAFYSSEMAASLPVPRCHLALRDVESGGTLVLIDDLRQTHRTVAWPYPPACGDCRLALKALAAIHAGTLLSGPVDVAKMVQREEELHNLVAGLLPALFDFIGDGLSTERRKLIEAALDQYVSLKEQRYRSGRFLCISHGDAHVWNFLYPKDAGRAACVLIDWEHWYEDFGAIDLSLMMTLHWFPERRQRFEEQFLRCYLEALSGRGLSGYTFDDLQDDYRIAHVCNVVVPVYQFQARDKHASWWPNLERWFLALDDLGARDMF